MEAPAHTRRTQRHARRAYDDTHSHTITRHSQFTVSITSVTLLRTHVTGSRHNALLKSAVEAGSRADGAGKRLEPPHVSFPCP